MERGRFGHNPKLPPNPPEDNCPPGFIPPNPSVVLDPKMIDLTQTSIHDANARLGGPALLHGWSLVYAADAHLGEPATKFIEEALLSLGERNGFTDRIVTCAGEIIPNAFQHGLPGSRVSVLLNVYGRPKHRIVQLIVENFLQPHQMPIGAIPSQQEMQAMIDRLRGRGLAMSCMIADEIKAGINLGYNLLVNALFDEESEKNAAFD